MPQITQTAAQLRVALVTGPRIFAHPEMTPQRLDCLADDAVQIEPVSARKFPSIRKNNREFCGRMVYRLFGSVKRADAPEGFVEIPCEIEPGLLCR
jgi:hypothetical protein